MAVVWQNILAHASNPANRRKPIPATNNARVLSQARDRLERAIQHARGVDGNPGERKGIPGWEAALKQVRERQGAKWRGAGKQPPAPRSRSRRRTATPGSPAFERVERAERARRAALTYVQRRSPRKSTSKSKRAAPKKKRAAPAARRTRRRKSSIF